MRPFQAVIIIMMLFISAFYADSFDKDRHNALQDSHLSESKETTIHNDYIAVQVEENTSDTDYGRFNIGTWPDEACLTYAYPTEPWSSWVIVRVDGISYKSPGEGCGYATPMIPMSSGITEMTWPTNTDSNYFYGGWTVPGKDIDVYQWLQPVYLQYSDYMTGTILIKYRIINKGTSWREIGVLLQLDTMVGGNDAAELASTCGYSGIEDDYWYDDECFPCYWYAYENISDPDALVALGILCAYDASQPDRFAVGSWGLGGGSMGFYNVEWNLTPSHNPYGDSSVLMWWYPVDIGPGDTLIVATYYGLGEPVSEWELFVPVYPSVEDCWYSPDILDVMGFFTNGTDVTLNNPVATLVLPAGISIEPGYSLTESFSSSTLIVGASATVDWQIQIDSDYVPHTDDSICAYVTSSSISGSLWTCKAFSLPEIAVPSAEVAYPFDNAVSSCPNQRLVLYLDSPNGIDELEFLASSDTIDLSNPQLDFSGDSLIFTPSTDWSNDAYYNFGLIYADDTLGCVASEVLARFFCDIAPPVPSNEYPADSAVVGTFDFGAITMRIIDNEREVDTNSIVFEVNGSSYTLDDDCLDYDGAILTFTPEIAEMEFEDGDTICCVLLDAADTEPDYCGQNHIVEPYEWCFWINIVDMWFPQPETTGCPGEIVDVPVYIEDVSGLGITSLDMEIGYFPSVITPVDVVLGGTICYDWAYLDWDIPEAGNIHISGSGPALAGRGVLFYMRFQVDDHMGAYSLLTFDEVILNDGDIKNEPIDGFFTTCWESEEWCATIFFLTKNMPLAHVSFGMSDSATDAYDGAIDLIRMLPPPGETDPWFDIDDPEHPEIDMLTRDFRSSESTHVIWRGHVAYTSVGESLLVFWNPASLPDGVILIKYSIPDGEITLDMHCDTIFSIMESETTDFQITFLRDELVRDTLMLCPGWNLLSLPLLPTGGASIREIIPNALTDGYWYNPLYHGYEILTVPAAGKAFWVYVAEPVSMDIAGMNVPIIGMHLRPGYNMIGIPAVDDGYVLTDEFSVIPEGSLLPTIYWFNTCETGAYHEASGTLYVGLGYWVYALEECNIDIHGDGLLKSGNTEPRFELDIYAGNSVLIAALDDNASNGIDFMDKPKPPLPPDMVEDESPAFITDGLRLSRDTRPCGNFTIAIAPGTTIEWNTDAIPCEYSFILNDGGVNCDMSACNTWVANSSELNINVNTKPARIALLPNKPNPFNSTTQIEFILPDAQDIAVELYDLSGAKIRTLLSGRAAAGLNSMIWDGTNDFGGTVPSGVYFVRLCTQSEILKRKITLLK